MLKLNEPVEVDETYKNAGRKGGKKRRDSRRRGRKGRGRGTYASDRPPTFTIYGKHTRFIIYRTTKNATGGIAKRIIMNHVVPNNEVHTDEYPIYKSISGVYRHRCVNHAARKYACNGVSVNGAEYANQRFKEFLINKRGVSKANLDGYSAMATIWVNTTTMTPKGAFWRLIYWLMTSKHNNRYGG